MPQSPTAANKEHLAHHDSFISKDDDQAVVKKIDQKCYIKSFAPAGRLMLKSACRICTFAV
jgi:hypothetical protein